MKVKFLYERVLVNTVPRPRCCTHDAEIAPGKTYVTVNVVLTIGEHCLKHMNSCRKLFQGTRPVAIEKEVV